MRAPAGSLAEVEYYAEDAALIRGPRRRTVPTPAAAPDTSSHLKLDPRLDPDVLGRVFARSGRIHVPGILEHASALRLHAAVTAPEVPWNLHYNVGDQARDVSSRDFDALAPEERSRFLAALHEKARHGFQYCFDNFPIYDNHQRGAMLELAITQAYRFLASEAMLELARRLTGVAAICVVDAQATRYRPGHFLTAHDDGDDAKGRIAAYVLNLTPAWRADWGGLLLFHDRDGHVAEGYTPAFNALNVMRVPALHSVSYVAPFAASPRLSITGWFRTR